MNEILLLKDNIALPPHGQETVDACDVGVVHALIPDPGVGAGGSSRHA